MFKKALLIGINYTGTRSELRGCVSDISHSEDVLIGKYGYHPENILVLTDFTRFKPTRANILAAFAWLTTGNRAADFLSGAAPSPLPANSHLYLGYSGHGSQVKDRNGDEDDGKDECICPLDYATAGMIIDDDIYTIVAKQVPAGCQLIGVFDSCHSQTICDLKWLVAPTGAGFTLKKCDQYRDTAGDVIILSGTIDSSVSMDTAVNGVSCGALTYAYLETLAKHNYALPCDQLLTEIKQIMTEKDLSDQIPCLSFGHKMPVDAIFKP